MTQIAFQDSIVCFNKAITAGHLSLAPKAENYAGCFMYMGTAYRDTDNEQIMFKDINTRQYKNFYPNKISKP